MPVSGGSIVQNVLDLTSQDECDWTRLVESLKLLGEFLQKSTLEIGPRDSVCKAIIENILSKLSPLDPREQDKLSALCELVLSHGDPDKVFRDLCVSLKSTRYALPVTARILVRFVRRKNGGVERITRILAKLESQETISFLVHLPSLVMNALGTSEPESNLVKERDYFVSLSEAICNVSMISDHQSAIFIGTLLQRMVTMGKAGILISSCCAFRQGRHLMTVMQRAPHACVEALIRALLEVDISSNALCDEGILRTVLCSVVLKNATAAEACVGGIPFSQPPLAKPRIALIRLVDAVAHKEDESVWRGAITKAATIWNSPEFTYCAEFSLQQQVTRLLLYYMSRRIRDRMRVRTQTDGLVLLFSPGIQLRLDENDPRIRRHGMVIGEAASKTETGNQKLSFPRDGLKEEICSNEKLVGKESSGYDSDSDLSTLAHDVDCNEGVDEEDAQVDQGSTLRHYGSPPNMDCLSNKYSQLAVSGDSNGNPLSSALGKSDRSNSSHLRKGSNHSWPTDIHDDAWQYEDDWESVDSWDRDGVPDDQSAVVHLEGREGDGTAFRVPISVNHLLNVMINANKTRGGAIALDAATVATALDQISGLSDSGLVYGETLRRAAVELCLEVCRLDVERYPDECKERLLTARQKALEQMICIDLQNCGLALIDTVICGPSSDISSRIEALSALTKAARASYDVSSSGNMSSESPSSDGSRHIESTGTRRVQRVSGRSRIASESTRTQLNPEHGLRTAGQYRLFHHLAQRMCDGGGAGFLQLEGRDSQLWGHAIVALATVASCAGTSREGVEMRSSVIEISMGRVIKFEADATVRRAVALAVIAVVKSMGEVEVTELLATAVSSSSFATQSQSLASSLVLECFDWLTHAAEFDVDIGVRRFTKQALGLWARRVQRGNY